MSAVLTPAVEVSREQWAYRAIEFVRSIGLSVTTVDDELSGSFVPGIRVEAGGLLVNLEKVFPGDVLHETGHLAVMPGQFRPKAKGTLNAVFRDMTDHLEANPEGLGMWPEDPTCRAILQCADPEATAWQYAAAQHIGLPDEWLFPEGSFEGNSKEILLGLKMSSYMGINGLQAAGWTKLRALARAPLPVYPKLAFWLHP